MLFSSLLAVLFASGLVSAAGIVLKPFIGDEYQIDRSQTKDQVLGPLRILLDTYHHKVSQECVRVVYLQLAGGGEEFLDELQVSCDVHTPFTMDHDVIDIKDGADVAHLTVAQGRPLWAVIAASQGGCVQRIYTDDNWVKLEETAETKLSETQCKQVMDEGRMIEPAPSTSTRRKDRTVDKLPELGETKGKIISLDDSYIDHYSHNAYQVVRGSSIKVTAIEEHHQFTDNCATVLHIDTISTEDCLDYAQLTCDKEAAFYVGEGMVVFGGLVYVRDQVGDPIWAVYVMEDHCVLRVFTDKEQTNLVADKDRSLTWDQCKRVIASKDVAWLPEQTEESTSLTGISLAGLKFLTGSRTSLTPSSSPVVVSKKPVTITPAPPADSESLLGRILQWGSFWSADTQTAPPVQERTPPHQNQGAAGAHKWFFWL